MSDINLKVLKKWNASANFERYANRLYCDLPVYGNTDTEAEYSVMNESEFRRSLILKFNDDMASRVDENLILAWDNEQGAMAEAYRNILINRRGNVCCENADRLLKAILGWNDKHDDTKKSRIVDTAIDLYGIHAFKLTYAFYKQDCILYGDDENEEEIYFIIELSKH